MEQATLIGRKLKQLRAVHNYTQEYVAEFVDRKQNSYSLMEKGKGLTVEKLTNALKAYDMTYDEFQAWQPGSVHQEHNGVANAYTTIDHQHVVSQEFVQEMMARFDKRFEDASRVNAELLRLNAQMVEAMTRFFDSKKTAK
jgi:transcriptional regulator with XRE-family HTH domain